MQSVGETEERTRVGGWSGWLLARLGRSSARRRLVLLERITLGPRQTLTLIEADGRRLLVASAAEGGAAFYPLDEPAVGRPKTARLA